MPSQTIPPSSSAELALTSSGFPGYQGAPCFLSSFSIQHMCPTTEPQPLSKRASWKPEEHAASAVKYKWALFCLLCDWDNLQSMLFLKSGAYASKHGSPAFPFPGTCKNKLRINIAAFLDVLSYNYYHIAIVSTLNTSTKEFCKLQKLPGFPCDQWLFLRQYGAWNMTVVIMKPNLDSVRNWSSVSRNPASSAGKAHQTSRAVGFQYVASSLQAQLCAAFSCSSV